MKKGKVPDESIINFVMNALGYKTALDKCMYEVEEWGDNDLALNVWEKV